MLFRLTNFESFHQEFWISHHWYVAATRGLRSAFVSIRVWFRNPIYCPRPVLTVANRKFFPFYAGNTEVQLRVEFSFWHPEATKIRLLVENLVVGTNRMTDEKKTFGYCPMCMQNVEHVRKFSSFFFWTFDILDAPVAQAVSAGALVLLSVRTKDTLPGSDQTKGSHLSQRNLPCRF